MLAIIEFLSNIKTFGSVALDKLADLYAQCDMCLVISGTNLSLLPLEVMASNSVPVCTTGANSEWLVNDENAVMVDTDQMQLQIRFAITLSILMS